MTDFSIARHLQLARLVEEAVFEGMYSYPGFRDIYDAYGQLWTRGTDGNVRFGGCRPLVALQFLAFLTEALINVITTLTRSLRAPPLVVRKDREYHIDLLFFRKPPHLRLFGRLLGYLNGVVAALKDRLSRFTGLDH